MTRPVETLVTELNRVLNDHLPDLTVCDLAINHDDTRIAEVIEVTRAIHRVRMTVGELGVSAPDVTSNVFAGGFNPPLPG